MKKSFRILLIIALFFVSLKSFAITEANDVTKDATLSLEDCVELSLKNSPNVRKYRNKLRATKSKVSQAKSDFFPTITAGTNFGLDGLYGDGFSSSEGLYNASATLNWLIFNFGKSKAKIDMQKYYVISAQNDLDNIILQTIFKVRTNYYAVLAAKAFVNVQKAYVDINERQYQRTKAYFEEGLKSKIDLVNAEVYLSESKIDLINAQNNYDNAIISLNNSMYIVDAPNYSIKNTETFNLKSHLIPVNLDDINKKEVYTIPETPKNSVFTTIVEKNDILDTFVFNPFPYNFEQSVAYAKEHRPDLKALYATEKAMEKSLLYTKREYYPALTAQAGYKFKRNTENYYSNGLTAGAYLNLPVINAANTKFKIDQAKAELDVAKDSVEMAEKDIYFEVQKAYIDMKKLERQIPLQYVKVRQASENFELADGRYEVGLGDFIELQDAKVKYNNAQREYVKIVFDYNVARAKLELTISMLPEEIKLTEEKNKSNGNTK